MKIVVFGGSGFVGSHVADALSDAGHEVINYDFKKSNYLRSDQKMIIGDILDENKVDNAIRGADAVYNFAGIADIEYASKNPLEAVKYNILGNTIILEGCRKNKVKRFVYASTLYVYSKNGSFYRASKQACELLIETYHETYGLDYTILRYGSLYGPRSDESNWIYSILKQAVIDEKITRYGDGDEIREYIHIKDVAKGSADILSDEFKNQYIIISGYQSLKIRELLTMIKEIMSNKIEIEYLPSIDNFHYEITPYSFTPKIAKKLVAKTYLDMGQGILECLNEIYHKNRLHLKQNEVIIEGSL